MAETRLADMIVPTKFNKYVTTVTLQKSRLLQSGIMTDLSAVVDAEIEGKTVNMPYFNDLDATDADVVIDDTQDLTVSKITTGQDVAVKLLRAKAWGATDLSADLAGADPIVAIANRIAEYWNRRDQATLVSTLAGAFAATNVLAGAGGFGNVLDITAESGAAANFDADSFIDATFLLGDEAGGLAAIACHSFTLKAMVKADLIDFVKQSDTDLVVPTYMGKTVIVDDSMPVSSGNYTTYLFGPGAIAFGQKSPKVPVEVERQALKGMGQEYVVHRRQFVMHPRGIKWLGGTQAGVTPTNAELATAANWTRVYEPKAVRIVQFKHKLAA